MMAKVCNTENRIKGHMRVRMLRLIATSSTLGILLLLLAQSTPLGAADVRDFDIENGHYYEQAGPQLGLGLVVADDDGIPLWREFQRLGGSQTLGYPISRRYICDEAVCQAFERAIFKRVPGAREVELISVFDWLHRSGQDAWLDERWGIPPWDAPEASAQSTRAETDSATQRAMIGANPLVKAEYDEPGALAPVVYGSARAIRVTGARTVLRTQRAVFVQAIDAPGQVQVLPAGRIFIDAGLVPSEALEGVPPPPALDDTPPVRIKIADLGINAAVVPMDMGADRLLPIPDNGHDVVWYSYGARLGEEGNAVMAGHIDWNSERGVFWALQEAQPGQSITITSGVGHTYEYRVDWARSFSEDSPEGLVALRSLVGGTTLTLVTCTGRFDAQSRSYLDRHIVRATLVKRVGPTPAA